MLPRLRKRQLEVEEKAMSAPTNDPLCPMCGGSRVQGRITSMTDPGGCVLVVRNVPATVCEQCGEEWLDQATVAELHRLAADARARGAQVEVLRMAS
jgi:YgiT-type zinc finger domain-containing protein